MAVPLQWVEMKLPSADFPPSLSARRVLSPQSEGGLADFLLQFDNTESTRIHPDDRLGREAPVSICTARLSAGRPGRGQENPPGGKSPAPTWLGPGRAGGVGERGLFWGVALAVGVGTPRPALSGLPLLPPSRPPPLDRPTSPARATRLAARHGA